MKSHCAFIVSEFQEEEVRGGANSRCVLIVTILCSYCIPIGGGGRKDGTTMLHCGLIYSYCASVVFLLEEEEGTGEEIVLHCHCRYNMLYSHCLPIES